MNAVPIDPSATVDSLVPKGGPPRSSAEGSSRLCGVYGIWCAARDKWYVGQSKNIVKRWRDHRCKLRQGTHINPLLQHAWSKYGESNFRFVVLELGAVKDLSKLEQEHTLRLAAECPSGFVLVVGGDHSRTASDTHRAKVSRSLRKYHREQRSPWLAARGLPWPEPEGLRYCGACLQLKPITDFYRRKTRFGYHHSRKCKRCYYKTDPRNAHRRSSGWKLTDEQRHNMSRRRKGWKPSAETRARMSAAQKLRRATDETKARMRAAWVLRKLKNKGKPK